MKREIGTMGGADAEQPFRAMRSEGLDIPVEAQVAAFCAWSARNGGVDLSYSGLGIEIDKALGGVWRGPHTFARAGDRMVQRLRKAGWISRRKRSWILTEDGAKARDDLVARAAAQSEPP